MPNLYTTIGILCSCAVIFVGRSIIIRLRKDGDMDSAVMVSILIIFVAMFTILVWPVVPVALALMWALGFCTVSEIKSFIRKHLRKSE